MYHDNAEAASIKKKTNGKVIILCVCLILGALLYNQFNHTAALPLKASENPSKTGGIRVRHILHHLPW